VTAAALVLLTAAVWGLLASLGWYTDYQLTDFGVYEKYGRFVAHQHLVPYRDFRLEYPPAALLTFVVPAWLDRFGYETVFKVVMFLCHLGVVFAALRLAGRRAAVAAAVAPLLLGSVVVSRFDLWPTALTALALAALVSGWIPVAAVLLGTAFAAKLWPAVIVPFAVVYVGRSYGRALATRFAAATAAVAAAWFIPFLIMSPGGIRYAFHAQFARPLQIESTGASILMALHHAFGLSIHETFGWGGQNLAGHGVGAVTAVTVALEVLVLVTIFLLFLRGSRDDEQLLFSCAAAVCTLIAFGKVFSPQFLIWLFPFAWLAGRRRGNVAAAVYAAALLLTASYFPHHYWDLANGFTRPQVAELLARNLACVALVVIFAWPRTLQHEVLGEHRARIEALQRVGAQVD
jgi:cbb3-type cytochrome oxidase subunit 3